MYNDNNNFNNNQMNNDFGSQQTGGFPPVQDPNVMTAFGTQPNYSQIDNNQMGMQPSVTNPSMTTAFGGEPNYSQVDNSQMGMQPSVTNPSMTTAFGTQPDFSQVDNSQMGMQPSVTNPSMTTAFGGEPNYSQVDNNQMGMQPSVTNPSMTTAFGGEPNYSQVDNNQMGMQPTGYNVEPVAPVQPDMSYNQGMMEQPSMYNQQASMAPMQDQGMMTTAFGNTDPIHNKEIENPMVDVPKTSTNTYISDDYKNFNQTSYDSTPQQDMGYAPQPDYGNPNGFVPPQFGQQKKDNSGIKFLIGFVIIVGGLIAAGIILWPKFSAKMNLKGNWECDNGFKFTFNGDKTFTLEQTYLSSTMKYSGTYDAKNGKLEESYKKYSKEGYNYLKVNIKIEKQEYLNNVTNFSQDGVLAFGIKGDDAHILKPDGTGITCHKK